MNNETIQETKEKKQRFDRPLFSMVLPIAFQAFMTAAVTANSIANIVRNLSTCVSKGIGTAVAILVGNELGKTRSNGRFCMPSGQPCFQVVCGLYSGLVLLALRPAILGATSLSPTAIGYLSGMLLICCYYAIPGAIDNTVIGGIFCAGGKSKFGLICDGIVIWLVIIPLGFLAAFHW